MQRLCDVPKELSSIASSASSVRDSHSVLHTWAELRSAASREALRASLGVPAAKLELLLKLSDRVMRGGAL